MTYEATIKDLVSCRDLISRLGIETENNKAICPFHNDTEPSMQIFADGFKCWSCGTHGDVIDLAEAYYNLPHKDAIIRLNSDFGLHLPIGGEYSAEKRIELQRRNQEREKAKNIAKLKRCIAEANYWYLFDKVLELTEAKRVFAPLGIGEPLHPLFVAAITELPRMEDELERAEARRTNSKKER